MGSVQYGRIGTGSQIERIADGIRSFATGRTAEAAISGNGKKTPHNPQGSQHTWVQMADTVDESRTRVIADLKSILPVNMDGEGCLYLSGKLKRITLDDTLFHIHNLSLLPAANLPVLSEINRKDASPEDVAGAIENDTNLAIRILSLTNSAYAGLGEDVTDIPRAINLLGFETVRSLIYLSRMMDNLGNARGPLEADQVFMHCLAASCAALLFTSSLRPAEANLVITAALFHDIGKILCSQVSRLKTEKALDQAARGRSFDKAQLEEFGISHYLMTAILLELWHFPRKLIKLICELAPNARNIGEEATALMNASSLVGRLGFDYAGTEDEMPILSFGLSPQQEKTAEEFILAKMGVCEQAL